MSKKNKQKQKQSEGKLYSPKTDPMGSYTGRPVDGGQPVQDADDL